MPEEQLAQLKEEIAALKEEVRQLRDHQHLGIDGSSLLLGSTPILAQSLGLIGSTIKRGDFLFAPFSITDGQVSNVNADAKQRGLGLGMAVSGQKDSADEQINSLLSASKISDPSESDNPTTKTDWTKVNFATLALIQSPQSTYSLSGPSFISPTSFLQGERTPAVTRSIGTITAGGSTLTDSTAAFATDSLVLSICNIYNSNGSALASYRVLANTANVLTLGSISSNGAITLASLPASGSYSYGVRTPVLLGSADVPWERLYVGEDIRLGYGSSAGSQVRYIKWGNGSPEGVVTANVGSIYLRFDGSTTTTLYVKTSGSGATGWTAK